MVKSIDPTVVTPWGALQIIRRSIKFKPAQMTLFPEPQEYSRRNQLFKEWPMPKNSTDSAIYFIRRVTRSETGWENICFRKDRTCGCIVYTEARLWYRPIYHLKHRWNRRIKMGQQRRLFSQDWELIP